MLTRRRARLATTLVAAGLAAACDTGTGPVTTNDLDTEAALADYEAMQAALGSSEFLGFRVLSGRTPFGAAPAAIDAVAGMTAPHSATDARAFALDLFRRIEGARSSRDAASSPIISGFHRGATFVYDPDLDRYVVDPDREGAPSTGVRFVIYEVDHAGDPIVDQERGYADLIDEGDHSNQDIALRLEVVEGSTTVLDYATTLDDQGTRGELTVSGYLQGDDVRLDFDIRAVGTNDGGTGTLDVSFDLGVEARGFSVSGSVSGVEEGKDGAGHIDVTVRHRDASIRADVSGDHGTLDGTIYLNDDVFATVSGTEHDPVFQGADGHALTVPEMLVLRHIFDCIEDVFDFLEDLVDPVDELVVLGAIL
jgi:hypothetical protein